jgi:hypothetical protein
MLMSTDPRDLPDWAKAFNGTWGGALNLKPPLPFSLGLHSHYKGGLYVALLLSMNSNNAAEPDPEVVYVSLTTGQVHNRSLAEWSQELTWPDGRVRPRFSPSEWKASGPTPHGDGGPLA